MAGNFIPPNIPLYLTPDSVPVGRFCRTISIPDDPTWVGLVDGVLSALADPALWRQYGTLTPEEAAQAWLEMIEGAWTIEGCPLDVRQSVAEPCILEKSDDNGATWVPFADLTLCAPSILVKPTGQIMVGTGDGFGSYTYDPPGYYPPGANIWTDITPTADMVAQVNDSCTAAANLAYVFRRVYEDMGTSLLAQPGIAELDLIFDFASTVSAIFKVAIPAETFFALGAGLLAIQALYGFTALSDAQFHDLVCIIKPTLTGTNGHWTVNGAALSTALAAKVASAGPLPWSFINLIGVNLGADGLNLGTKTTNFSSYDCTTGEAIRLWRHYDDFGVTNNGALLQLFMPDALPEQFAFMRWRSYLAPGTNTLGNSVGATPVGWPPPFGLTVSPNPFVVGSDMWWVNQVAYPAPLATSAQPQIRKAVNNPAYNPLMFGGGIGTGNFLAGSLMWHHFTIGGGGGSGAWNYHLSRDYYTRSVYGGC